MRLNNPQPLDPVASPATQGFCYEGFFTVAAVAAQSSLAQLWAPPANGLNVVVLDVLVSLATAGDVVLSYSTVQLGSDHGQGLSTYLSGNTGNARVKTSNNASIPGTQFARLSLPVAQSINIARAWEIVIPSPAGMVVAAVTVNVAMTVSFRWIEIYG